MDFTGKFIFYLSSKKPRKKESNHLTTIPAPRFLHHEMRRCKCCTHPKRTIITLDPAGREQYTCPETRTTMRWSEGAKTYLKGGLVLP